MKLGIVGLPNVGKSTLFNSITNNNVDTENFPFCTIEPNIGIVEVNDYRVDNLSALYKSKKTIKAVVEFVDIAGLVKGASKGNGLGNKFLSNIREVDAIVHVVRCFKDSNIIHVDGDIDPIRDIETINLELIFSDLEIIEKRIDKIKKLINTDKKLKQQFDLLMLCKNCLENNKMLYSLDFQEEDKKYIKECNFLTIKPVIYALNIHEDIIPDYNNDKYVKQAINYIKNNNLKYTVVSAQFEYELSKLPNKEDKDQFLNDLGVKESGLDILIRESYKLLGLISFFTTGEDETRAWTIKKGTKAVQAAGKIHTDFERGFIKAEIVSYDTLIQEKSFQVAKEKGLVRMEGKDYIVQDGDVVIIKFNV